MPLLLLMLGGGLLAFALSRQGTNAMNAVLDYVLPAAAQPYVALANKIGPEYGVAPSLLLAIMARESAFGLTLSPPGPGGTGDAGHGRGLMQIDDRAHSAWIQANNWRDPEVNIRKGAEVLAQNIRIFGSRVALAPYSDGRAVSVTGANATNRGVAPGVYTDPRPLAGDELNAAALAAYNAGAAAVLMSLAVGLSPDHTTTGRDYSAWVFAKLAEWSA